MPTSEVTQILNALSGGGGEGDERAAARLLPLVYDELRALAGSFFARQTPGHTLQPTALVHEAYLKLAGSANVRWEGRAHFFAVAARAMRQILMNHARDKSAAKRGGGWTRITLDKAVTPPGTTDRQVDLLALDEALEKLSALSDRQARVIELRFFAGLTIAETAHVLGVGTTTVEDDWHLAKAWLVRELKQGPAL
jgi:RNA polymerase sigma factor (TIGR02999 family)